MCLYMFAILGISQQHGTRRERCLSLLSRSISGAFILGTKYTITHMNGTAGCRPQRSAGECVLWPFQFHNTMATAAMSHTLKREHRNRNPRPHLTTNMSMCWRWSVCGELGTCRLFAIDSHKHAWHIRVPFNA